MRHPVRRTLTASMFLLFALLLAAPAMAADPGQSGEPVARVAGWDDFETWFRTHSWGDTVNRRRLPQQAPSGDSETRGWDSWKEAICQQAMGHLMARSSEFAAFVKAYDAENDPDETGTFPSADEVEAWWNANPPEAVKGSPDIGKRVLIGTAWGWLEAHHDWAPGRGSREDASPKSNCSECTSWMGDCFFCWPSPCPTCF